ncbi:MAG: tRNA uridine-5-carboxymethylaminomethyl(34) synthesis GTPase MnmE [Candidatus Nitrospinota bacterium M3_3B_026]
MTNEPGGPVKQQETIAAISTPVGEGGVGMVRVSGAGAVDIAKKMFREPSGGRRDDFEPRRVCYGYVTGAGGERIDEVLMTVMLSPNTYTREDMVEITCHGGPMVVRRVLDASLAGGARLAEPGEFSKRAFLNGRIDLVQAEAIIDIIRSRSEKGWKTAFSQLDGKLSETLSGIEKDLVDVMAALEASIDFPDEELDIAGDERLRSELVSLRRRVEGMILSYDAGRIYREGVAVAIVGRPNVGKSSLMNALLERERVIVTPVPGTTRDTVEETLQIEGIAVRIVDTAGVREAADEVEKIGVEKTLAAAREADVVLFVLDSSEPLKDEDIKAADALAGGAYSLIPVVNKSDRTLALDTAELQKHAAGEPVFVSAKTGEGLDGLRRRIAREVERKGEPLGEGPPLTRERHVSHLKEMAESIGRAIEALDAGMSREFIAADLAEAREAVARLTGKAFDDQVLDRIFSEFCIGK